MNDFDRLADRLKTAGQELSDYAFDEIEKLAYDMETDMKENIVSNGNIDTGELLSSIHHDVEREDEHLKCTIVSDAKSNNRYYWRFLEYGTGIHNVTGNGRKTPWPYFYTGIKPKEAVHYNNEGFVFTHGAKPHPFAQPAIDSNMSTLEELRDKLSLSYFLNK